MESRCWIATAMLAAGCGAATPQPVSRPALGGAHSQDTFAVLGPYATLYAAPSESALHARRISAWPVPMRVMSVHDGWVEVASPDEIAEDEQCYGPPPFQRGLRLHVFVHDNDLAPVTTREVHVDFDDDTSVTLAPGVMVLPMRRFSRPGREIYTAYASDLMFNTTVPVDAIGRTYRSAGNYDDPGSTHRLADPHAVAFGGNAHVAPFGEVRPFYVYGRIDKPSGTLVDLRTRCALLTVHANPQAVVDTMPATVSQPAAGGTHAAYVESGSALYWPDGTRAGEAREDLHFDVEVAPTGGRRCFRRGLGPGWSADLDPTATHALTLCADPDDVQGAPPATAPVPSAPPASAAPSEAPASEVDAGAGVHAVSADAGAVQRQNAASVGFVCDRECRWGCPASAIETAAATAAIVRDRAWAAVAFSPAQRRGS